MMQENDGYIHPKSMAYLHQKILGKDVALLLISDFLWFHAVLQENIEIYTAMVMLGAFIIMARFHSRVLALLILVNFVGVFYLLGTLHYIALWLFSGALFIGSVLIVGGKRREILHGVKSESTF